LVASTIENNFDNNDDIIDYHDYFKPWLNDPQLDTDLLGQIHIERDEELQTNIKALCKEYEDIFSNTLPSALSSIEPFDIKVDEVAWKDPKNRFPLRRQNPTKEVEIERQISILLDDVIIKRSKEAYWSKVVLAPKPDDEWRLYIDFQNLNTASDPGGHPIPNITDMLNRIGDHKSNIYGVLDLTQGYHQCARTLSTMVLTAFIVFCGIFQFTRLLFGPKKVPSHFPQ
jgi:hypothetical protein